MSSELRVDPDAVDEARLAVDPAYRFAFLAAFVGLTPADRALIRASRAHLEPWMPTLLARLRARLLGFSSTRRHFAGRPPEAVAVHLGAYVDTLLRLRDDEELGRYLAWVAEAHGPEAGDPPVASPTIAVPLVQIGALLGFVADEVTGAVAALDLPETQRLAAIRAWSKLLWIQAEMFQWRAAAGPR